MNPGISNIYSGIEYFKLTFSVFHNGFKMVTFTAKR
jgi:hypothetical protein